MYGNPSSGQLFRLPLAPTQHKAKHNLKVFFVNVLADVTGQQKAHKQLINKILTTTLHNYLVYVQFNT